MAKKEKKDKRNGKENESPFHGLSEETLQGVSSVIFFAITVFFVLASLHKAGIAGDNLYTILSYLLGIGYFLLPIIFTMLGLSFLKSLHQKFSFIKIIGSLFFFIAGLGMINVIAIDEGGILGKMVSSPLTRFFGTYTSLIFLFALLVISFLVIFDTGLRFTFITSVLKKMFGKKETETDVVKIKVLHKEDEEMEDDENKKDTEKTSPVLQKNKSGFIVPKTANDDKEFSVSPRQFQGIGKKFVPIPLSLLERDSGTPGVGDIKANANIIKRSLQNFGIDVEMDEISIGPSVTRYALKPAEGIKLSRIVGLQNDLSLALAAHPIRIEAPIPGKSLVGIEIPNSTKTTVGLATLLSADEYQKSEKPLLVSLGKGISGKSHFGNLAKMPHLLIAGATGSGKSVTIHSIITSLLFRNSPESLKFIMIDPKRVELTLYNKTPHLLTPVITEAKKAILALKWAAKEMDRRYDILESESVRDIESYHKNILAPAIKRFEEKSKKDRDAETEEGAKIPEAMPYLVVVIDELADIMSTYPRELESAIVRLAQMSRAVGIHLILSTQRPSVNVITGLIKANIPARIALQVASQIDSRTILDMGGAEKLLGAGDMLYLSGEMSQPERIQSSFISEGELKRVVKFLIDTYKDEIPNEINLTANAVLDKNAIFESTFGEEENGGDEDDLYEQAREEVMRAGKASTSYLQRKLRIGYSRAARLVDMLEERGVVGPGGGAKSREVIVGGTETKNENPAESDNQAGLNQL